MSAEPDRWLSRIGAAVLGTARAAGELWGVYVATLAGIVRTLRSGRTRGRGRGAGRGELWRQLRSEERRVGKECTD